MRFSDNLQGMHSLVDRLRGPLRAALEGAERMLSGQLAPEDSHFCKNLLGQTKGLLALLSDEESSPEFKGQRILLACPESPQRQQLCQQMRQWGLEPQPCNNCQAAYQLALQSTRLGAVVLDGELPDYQGPGTLQAIRQAGSAPVLLLGSEELPDEGKLLDCLRRLLNTPKPAATSKPNGQLGRRHPLKILVAEDMPLNQKLISLLLSRLGYQADTANNGYEVMLRTEKDDYDLILMDLNMPGMNGLEAARRVRQQKPFEKNGPRLVAMSANLPNGTPQGSGFEEFLAKPVQFEQLQNVLRNSPSRCPRSGQSTPPSQPILDPEIMGNLRGLGDQEFLVSLIDDAAQELPQMVGMLMDCWERAEASQVAQLAHAIKGSVCTLGATRAAQIAAEIEHCGKVGKLEGRPVVALAEALEEALERLQTF
jgi:CheY-like chemotaxis protein